MNQKIAATAGKGATANQAAFAEWVLTESGLEFKTAAARAAFVQGATLAVTTYKT